MSRPESPLPRRGQSIELHPDRRSARGVGWGATEFDEAAALRARGRWPPPDGPRAAIVGSRRPSPYGEAVAEQLGANLARAGVIVISGLALGIDAAAHRGALLGGGVTVAVMGTGVDIVYPASHGRLAEDILAAGGALVSQFPDGTTPRRHNFPARNWTMAALSDVVVVVEAAQGSGALITADAALELHKEVMAVPGSVFSPLSVGTHGLIRDGAALVQNARDVLAALGATQEVLDDPLPAPKGLGLGLFSGRDGILSHLSDVLALSAAEIARKLQLPVAEVLGRLTALELDGAVRRHHDGYVRALRKDKQRA
ncbi:MAG: DNA-processing protein DprA [Candidatus Dormibacteraceae bacterium]